MKNKNTSSTQLISRKVMFLVWVIASCSVFQLNAQELEPRSLTNLPTRTQFALINYAHSNGEVLMDQALPIEDLNASVNSVLFGYIRSIGLLKNSGKLGVLLPYVNGDWSGTISGTDSSRHTSGFGDMRILFSYNLWGSPALKKQVFSSYEPENILGLSFTFVLPTGKNENERLVNIGSNRVAFKSQIGYAHYFNKWIVESYVALWLYGKNSSFYGSNTLQQSPLFTSKIHGIYTAHKKFWLAIDLGYGIGARSYVNKEKRSARISTLRFGATAAYALMPKHTLKLNWVSGVRFERGADFDNVSLTYQYMWN